jgi:uncharacterized protein (TIGR01777 family)
VHVVLSGASGLIGVALRRSLHSDGHSVTTLVRREPDAQDEMRWDPSHHTLDPSVLANADAVVCLSGAGVGDHRWSEDYKRTILESRVDSVATVADAMVQTGGPRTLITASAVGYYGDTGDAPVDERTPAGTNFLAGVCTRWEAAAQPARDAGIRVAALRTGLVLSSQGGLLKRLKPIIQAGVAGKLGSGRQFMPWISLADEVRAIRFLLQNDVCGPVNLTGPVPVRNAEFMKTLGRVLHRPTILPTPAFALRLALGQFAEDILGGQRAVPAVLTAAEFTFEHADLESALRWALEH